MKPTSKKPETKKKPLSRKKEFDMKKRPNQSLYAILSSVLILMIGAGHLSAETPNTLQPPKDQIALQLGAIQMGYAVPFTLTGNISTQKMQQAANALVMGRNALDATVDAPAVKVQGAVDCPSVDSVEYRNQLYSAVEYVVTSPVVATVKGYVKLVNNKKVELNTKLNVPPNAWTIPIPYALESRSSADVMQVVDFLVSAGLMTPDFSPGMITVAGGTLPVSSGLGNQTVASFQIGKYEVTYGEWKEVQSWALEHGYSDLAGIGANAGVSNQNPVTAVSCYDVVKWSNAKSEKEGKTAVYMVNGTTYKTGEVVPTVNTSANGYRLPSEKEWEWAARGGAASQGYTYSGSNDINAVAWYKVNSSGGTKAVGTKGANELGIYDMSGSVWEWCWDVYDPYPPYRSFRGGSWFDIADYAAVAYRSYYPLEARLAQIGFRLARNSGN